MEGATSTMTTLLAAASSAIEFSGTCLTTMIGNPVYAFFFGAGLVSVGLTLISMLKNTARH